MGRCTLSLVAWVVVASFELSRAGGTQVIKIAGAATGPHGTWVDGPVGLRYWRLHMDDNWGATWGTGFSSIEFLPAPKPKLVDECARHTTCDACAFSRDARGGVLCGWCVASKRCLPGNPKEPSHLTCRGAWAWNSCDAAHALRSGASGALNSKCGQAHPNCRSCNAVAGCSWCLSALPRPRCQAGQCRNWAPRGCEAESARYLERVEHGVVVAPSAQRLRAERSAERAVRDSDQRLAKAVVLLGVTAVLMVFLSAFAYAREWTGVGLVVPDTATVEQQCDPTLSANANSVQVRDAASTGASTGTSTDADVGCDAGTRSVLPTTASSYGAVQMDPTRAVGDDKDEDVI